MAVWGEVSYKVKRAITFRERFSVAELVDATDLTYPQVEQVVQRLIQQQYVRPLGSHELKPAEQTAEKRVGRPRKRYTLVEDQAKRGQLYAEVEAIASAERMSRARGREPSTPFFTHALQIIQAMERGKESVCTARLEEAEEQLTAGRDFEGLVPEGVELVQAHYDSAMARLKALQEDYSSADELLTQAEEAFQAAGADEQVQKAIDLRLALKASQRLAKARKMIERQSDPRPALEDLKILVREFASPSYLLLPLQQAIEAIDAFLWTAVQERQIAVRANTRALQQNTEAVKRMSQAIEKGSGEIEISRELIPSGSMGAMEPYPYEETRFWPAEMHVHIVRREERVCIPASAFKEIFGKRR